MLNNFARGLLAVILSVLLVGFGICGAYGTLGGVANLFDHSSEGRAFAPVLIGAGLLGLAIAWICWKLVTGLWRKRPPGGQ
jgi:uncharacterized membrane protein